MSNYTIAIRTLGKAGSSAMQKVHAQRNYGIDLLRIAAAYMITLCHVLGHGGILASKLDASQNGAAWFLEIIGLCGVDCYALISGYVGYRETDRPQHFSRYFELWLEAVFYDVVISSLFKLFGGGIGTADIVKTIFPVTFNQYWYLSAYTGVFLLMPFLNRLIRKSSFRQLFSFCLISFLILSVYGCIGSRYSDPFKMNYGYSFVWLALLFIYGGTIRKFSLSELFSRKKLLGIMVVLFALAWIWKLVIGPIIGHGIDGLLVSYISPTITLMCICALMIFSKMKIGRAAQKLIGFCAPCAFGIYLFQEQSVIRDHFITGSFAFLAKGPALILFLGVQVFTFLIFGCGLVADRIRILLFKVCRIQKLTDWMEDVIRKGYRILRNYLLKISGLNQRDI